jgi:hypothetical protein
VVEVRGEREIYVQLRALGITPNYAGYFQTVDAVVLCAEAPERLTQITKQVYMEVGKRYGVKWAAVERNIRTVARIAWERNRALLEELVGCELSSRPFSSQFVAALTMRVLSSLTHDGLSEAAISEGSVPLAELEV